MLTNYYFSLLFSIYHVLSILTLKIREMQKTQICDKNRVIEFCVIQTHAQGPHMRNWWPQVPKTSNRFTQKLPFMPFFLVFSKKVCNIFRAKYYSNLKTSMEVTDFSSLTILLYLQPFGSGIHKDTLKPCIVRQSCMIIFW